jgi:hypothetical protein
MVVYGTLFVVKSSLFPLVAIITSLKENSYTEAVDLSTENLELVSPELVGSLTKLRTLKLNSASVVLPQLTSLFESLCENSCRLRDLGKGEIALCAKGGGEQGPIYWKIPPSPPLGGEISANVIWGKYEKAKRKKGKM